MIKSKAQINDIEKKWNRAMKLKAVFLKNKKN